MRAALRTGPDARLRAAALLLICTLVLALAVTGRSAHPHKHLPRGTVVVAVMAWDGHHAAEAPATLPAASALAVAGAVPGVSANSSQLVSSRTAQAPQVRGPPGQAAA